ncbi:putative UTP-glucose-1-phosphate uridylyltransferase [Flammula alnicola]|nr:putative UTP-glucose-1-phosphate uridylyltransferase [Flammula alnicola]
MPLFKQPIHRLRRRPAKYFPDLPETDAAKSMSDELSRLVTTVPDASARNLFLAEMQSFLTLYNRYLSEKGQGQGLDWEKVSPPAENQIVPYELLPNNGTAGLNKLAVLKVNGGLGTSMGMNGAKCALEVQDDLTFLELVVQQVEHLNTTERTDVPLLLMTSFNTEEDTLRIVKKYANRPVKITTFNQSRYPRILKESLLPFAKAVQEGKAAWYPPGHGDLFNSLNRSGEYLFVSNSDNLGAVVDKRILQYMIDTQSEFVMEVTSKSKVDIKVWGTLINYDGTVRLLEITQVPAEFIEEFNSARRFRIFNTNNLWINLRALKRILRDDGMVLDIIPNSKTMEDGRTVLQLETAAGSAIKHFQNAHGVHVPRSRFLPVKNCSDLLLVKSDLFVLDHGRLVMNENRIFGIPPIVKLGEHFRKIHQFQKRFKQVPHIIELDHLTVAGDVYFGRNVTLRGTVIIVANEGQRIDIPDGCILENRLVSGNLNMIVSLSFRPSLSVDSHIFDQEL